MSSKWVSLFHSELLTETLICLLFIYFSIICVFHAKRLTRTLNCNRNMLSNKRNIILMETAAKSKRRKIRVSTSNAMPLDRSVIFMALKQYIFFRLYHAHTWFACWLKYSDWLLVLVSIWLKLNAIRSLTRSVWFRFWCSKKSLQWSTAREFIVNSNSRIFWIFFLKNFKSDLLEKSNYSTEILFVDLELKACQKCRIRTQRKLVFFLWISSFILYLNISNCSHVKFNLLLKRITKLMYKNSDDFLCVLCKNSDSRHGRKQLNNKCICSIWDATHSMLCKKRSLTWRHFLSVKFLWSRYL